MNSQSFRFEAQSIFRWGTFLGAVILLTLTAGVARRPSGPAGVGRTVRVQGRRLTLGRGALAPISGEERRERGEAGGDQHARLLRWIESRHPAPPGTSWSAVEAANREAAAAWAGAQARSRQPVWHERGPLNMAGVTVVSAVRADGKTLLVGSGRGGLFSGTPGGPAWTPIPGSLGGGYIAGLAVSSPPETWVAAVDRSFSGALYVSRNHGVSWSAPRGLPRLLAIDELVQDGGDRRTLYLLARVDQGNGSGLPILARSRDGGVSFTIVRRWSVAERAGLWTSRVGAGPLYLMSGGQLAVSTDHGTSFSPVGPVFAPRANYVILRGSEAGAPTFYAAVGRDAFPDRLYVSEDGGLSWEERFRFGESDRFTGALTASIADPRLVLFGSVEAWRSADGGRTFAKLSDWTEYNDAPASRLHADVRGLEVALYQGRETLFLDTDGGTYLSTDGGQSVSNLTLNGLGNAQLYSTWSSAASPDHFLAGSQDQGFQETLPPAGGRAGAPLGTVQRITGDFTGLTSASHDLANVFALYPGALLLFAPGGDASSLLLAELPATATIFAQSLAADPDDPFSVYVGGDHIWKMSWQGGDYFQQTELPQSFAGDREDAVFALTVAPSDHRVWYAATLEGHIWSSRDHGVTWTDWDAARAGAPYMVFLALRVSDTDPLTCFAGGGGYGTPPLWVTHDGGASWKPAAKGLPPTVVSSLAFDGAGSLYAATQAGPWVRNAASSTWRSLLGGGAPIIEYTSVEAVPAAHLMRFGTFGRGVWDYGVPGGR